MNPKIKISIFISTIAWWLALWTFMYHFLEKWSLITSFYFSAITLTTVWYGDLHPTTEISRLFTAFYVLDWTTIVVAALGVVGTYFLEKKIKKKQ